MSTPLTKLSLILGGGSGRAAYLGGEQVMRLGKRDGDQWQHEVYDSAVHRKATVVTKCEGHEGLAGEGP